MYINKKSPKNKQKQEKIFKKKKDFSKNWRINRISRQLKHYINNLIGGNLNEQS